MMKIAVIGVLLQRLCLHATFRYQGLLKNVHRIYAIIAPSTCQAKGFFIHCVSFEFRGTSLYEAPVVKPTEMHKAISNKSIEIYNFEHRGINMTLIGFFALAVVAALFVLFSGLAIWASLGLESDDLNARSIKAPPKDQESTISKTPEEPLLFGVFTFANDSESMSVMRQQYSSNDSNHYVIHSIRSLPEQLWLYDTLPTHRKMILVQSIDNITYAMKIGQRYDLDVIVYDIEQWEKTPKLERIHPLLSIRKGADIAHEAGYRYGIAPDALTLIDNYKIINWKEIDFLDMQLQRFSQNVTEYSNIANEISTFVRSKNADIEIFTQLSFRFTNANDMIKVIESVKDIVNGFIIFYDTNSQLCISTCSPQELNLVLEKINGLTRHNNNYTIN